MFQFLFKKQKVLEHLLNEYFHSVEMAQENFLHAMDHYFQTGQCCPDFEFLAGETHKAESKSDDIQEQIILLLFEKALIPEFRGDVLNLLEAVDDVPDQFDRILHGILSQKIVLKDAIMADLKDLVSVSMDVCSLMLEGVRDLFRREKEATQLLKKADQMESRGDRIERRIITRIFESDWDPLQKILLRDLTSLLGDIADQAVHVCRQVNLITIKRQV